MTDWVNKVQFKKCTCFNEQEVSFPLENTIALYIVPTRRCNVNCPFCTFKADNVSFNIEIFKQRFSELLQIAIIDTVHFTGGEPSLEIDQIKAVCHFIKEVSPLTTISVNTNGSFIEDLCNIPELDNISLSRHHYDDKKNKQLFGGISVPNTERLLSLPEKEKLHLSCNLVKGYIDNETELLQFLEFSSYISCNDVGFVSLMKVNDFCKNHFVDFSQFNLSNIKNLHQTKAFFNKDTLNDTPSCCCKNFLYLAKNMNMVSIYHRHAIKNNCISDYLVFENNHIKQGFSGNILI